MLASAVVALVAAGGPAESKLRRGAPAKADTARAAAAVATPAPPAALPDVADMPAPDVPAIAETFQLVRCEPTWWAGVDYLSWWTKNLPVKTPFVSTGPESDPFAGALDRPGTRVLYGDDPIDLGPLSGLRLRAGLWLDDAATVGAEVTGMVLEEGRESATFSGGSVGRPFFGLPFVNARTGQQNVFFVSQNFNDPAVSAFLTGDLDITTKSRYWAYEINGLVSLYRSPDAWVVGLLGFRSMGLDESVTFTESLRPLAPGSLTFGGAPVLTTQRVGTVDDFQTENRFYGPQVGTRVGTAFGDLLLTAHATVALGVTRQERTIEGSSSLSSGGRTLATLPGGVFALPSNIGRESQSDFSVVPEAGLGLDYQFTPWLTAKFGYNFVYWNSVVRATRQVDSTLDPVQVPTDVSYGTAPSLGRPSPSLRTSDFWAQGINFGFEIRR